MVGFTEKENQVGRPRKFIFAIRNALAIAKASLMIPTYFLLMSGLKVLDKKDKLQKKEQKGYYF